ncbi:restriction endonuclease subunit S, partial [Pedobacter miscanthi]
ETQSKIIEDLETQFKNLVIKLLSSEITFKDKNGKDYPKWEIEKLGNIATFRRGSFPQPYGLPKWYDQAEGFPFIQVFDVGENMRLKNKTKNKISQLATEQSVFAKKGTLILTIQGSIGRVAKTDFDAYIDRTLLIFQSFQRDINIDFFKYAIFLLFEVEKEKAPGGIIKTITKEVLTQFTVPVPSYDEQTKIAEVFTLMESKLEVEKKILSSYKYQKQHILSNLFI